jgi:hypothetical protein
LKAKFPRQGHATIPFEQMGQRRIDISLMVRLYNHQVSAIGMNQILSTFMPEYSPERSHFTDYFTGRAINENANDIVQDLARE